MSTPLVSLVITCYNHADYLAQAISSCLEQTYVPLEVIVINDGSTDDSASVAARFGDAIHYVEQPNGGVGAARNMGIRTARGEYVALLDDDDVALPNRIACQVEYLNHHPNIGMVASDAWLFDGANNYGLLSEGTGKPEDPADFRWQTPHFTPYPSTYMLRRSCFEACGGFDERLRRAGAEDWLFLVRFAAYCGMAYLDQPLVRHRRHGSNMSNNLPHMHSQMRWAAQAAVQWEHFADYPAAMQARLHYVRFACSWRTDPKQQSLQHLWTAVRTDPGQLPYGWKILRRGLAASIHRWFH